MNRTILVAHDDSSARGTLQQILETEGYDVVHADSGQQTLALAAKLEVDVLLLRVGLPAMDGRELCKTIRT